jgi:predicted nucleic acid-binding protein
MFDTLVVNASPLIFLGNAGRLDLLRRIGASRVMVPQSVFDEVTTTQHADRAAHSVAEADWIERVAALPIPGGVLEWDLGLGESCVIAACLQMIGAGPVIDDLSGRKCALALGLQPIGTLGVVIAAHRRGHLDDPRQVLLDLRDSGMWLSDTVIERALRLAGVQ